MIVNIFEISCRSLFNHLHTNKLTRIFLFCLILVHFLLRVAIFVVTLYSVCFWLQAALDKGKNSDKNEDSAEDASQGSEPVDSVVSQMNGLAISSNSAVVTPPLDVTESSTPSDHISDIDKRIRALKKKVSFLRLLTFQEHIHKSTIFHIRLRVQHRLLLKVNWHQKAMGWETLC